ncbi:hypothetical protein GQ43DRAFT_430400 [Delitschia confertaspora ATCC 74209]|uniref:Uncharacterized protein n=1 Tax=Delitschia confertaspora ATCC 74209 TaxID=1513339 RepID=A0A9P4N0F4_9PLEO|nr:hypothetical protein GQ43DRAFT_430400 [Delitschia confertaspora ATCC 74209]
MYIYRRHCFRLCGCEKSLKTDRTRILKDGTLLPPKTPRSLLPAIDHEDSDELPEHQRPRNLYSGIHIDAEFCFEYGDWEDELCDKCDRKLQEAVKSMYQGWWGTRIWAGWSVGMEPKGETPKPGDGRWEEYEDTSESIDSGEERSDTSK